MNRFSIVLSSMEDVQRFCSLANQHGCDIDVCSGRYVVNGKSIMGLCSLDRTAPAAVEFHGSEGQSAAFQKALGRLVVE